MAEVFLARRVRRGVEARVALKRILPGLADEPIFRKMLLDEARILAELDHPNIVRLLELVAREGHAFIVMEYVRGPSLLEITRRLYRERQRMWAPFAAQIVAATCDALEHAHSRWSADGRPLHIVHRDVNPANLLLSVEGEVKLCDFGIALSDRRSLSTESGAIKGKYCYMAPEQALGVELDRRTDIYAAGLVLYELLTGENPLVADTDVGMIERARRGVTTAPSEIVPDLPPSLEQICLRALARDPDDRFQRAGELAQALRRFLRTRPVSERAFAAWIRQCWQGSRSARLEPPPRALDPADPELVTIPFRR